MAKIVLSTANIINGSASILRRPAFEKTNVELINSLRSNLLAAKEAFAPTPNGNGSPHREHDAKTHKDPLEAWTERQDDILFIPSIDYLQSGLAEERSQYDITVKLFFAPSSMTSDQYGYVQKAVDLVFKELHVSSVDLLLVSFPGIAFDDAAPDCKDAEPNGLLPGKAQDMEAIVSTWEALEELQAKGLARQIGVAEFGLERLQSFLKAVKTRPSVDQINLRDCCVVPQTLSHFAKQENIELLSHNDCANILPSGTLRELLGTGEQGAGVLLQQQDPRRGLKGDLQPQWVIKYTAVIKDRGVVENKGYFAMAELTEQPGTIPS